MRFLAGLIIGVLLIPVGGYFLLKTGNINMAARGGPSVFEERIGNELFVESMKKRAPQKKNPYADDASVLSTGMEEYKENCVVCHSAPGMGHTEIGKGLNPPPPTLDEDDVQHMSDGQLFWITENGIRMTGMPAFGETHSEEEIWKIVAFVRHLPQLTAQEKETLKASMEEEEEEDHP